MRVKDLIELLYKYPLETFVSINRQEYHPIGAKLVEFGPQPGQLQLLEIDVELGTPDGFGEEYDRLWRKEP